MAKPAASRSTAPRCRISQAIKTIGLFTIPVVLHPEVRVNVTINVARSEDEAERQARGEDVLAERTEQEEAKVAAEELFEEGAGPRPKKARKNPPRPDRFVFMQNKETRPARPGFFVSGRARYQPSSDFPSASIRALVPCSREPASS